MKHPYLKFTVQKPIKKSRSKSYSSQINYLFAQNTDTTLFQANELELLGILDMVGGLEYHHKRFMRMENIQRKHLQKIFEAMQFFPASAKNMFHEVVAYINRLGQIKSLFRSDWFEKNVQKSDLAFLCPIILALMPFRNKFTAHRSCDYPRQETDTQKASHASLPFDVKWIGTATNLDTWSSDLDMANICYSIQISDEPIWLKFIPTKQHDSICTEIISTVKNFLTKKH